jgi:hypothetical protein
MIFGNRESSCPEFQKLSSNKTLKRKKVERTIIPSTFPVNLEGFEPPTF